MLTYVETLWPRHPCNLPVDLGNVRHVTRADRLDHEVESPLGQHRQIFHRRFDRTHVEPVYSCHFAIQALVVGAVDDSHPTFSNLGGDAVIGMEAKFAGWLLSWILPTVEVEGTANPQLSEIAVAHGMTLAHMGVALLIVGMVMDITAILIILAPVVLISTFLISVLLVWVATYPADRAIREARFDKSVAVLYALVPCALKAVALAVLLSPAATRAQGVVWEAPARPSPPLGDRP